MPHTIVEYSENLRPDGDIPGMMQKLAAMMRDTGGVFPVGGIRIRAIPYDEYVAADGDPDNTFVVITFKIARGRSEDFKTAFFGGALEMLKGHFREVYDSRPFSLAMYVEEIPEGTSYRWNNMHDRLKARSTSSAA